MGLKKNLKILVLGKYYGVVFRGAEIFIQEMTKRWSKKHFCRIVSLSKNEVILDKNLRNSATVERHSYLKTFSSWLKNHKLYFIFKLIPFMRKLVYTNMDYKFERKVEAEIKKFIPDIIVHQAGPGIQELLNNIKKKEKLNFKSVAVNASGICWQELQVALKRPDIYVCQTPSQLNFIMRYAPRTNSVLIPNGADLELFNPRASKLDVRDIKKISKMKKVELEHPVIISTAAIEPNKEVDFLIKAVAKLRSGSMIVTGNGSQKNAIIRLGKKLLGKRFVYLGVVNFNLLPRVYRSGDLFVLCSKNEPFGNVFIEAMACGIPVISRDEEDRRWMIKNGGFYSKMRDEEELAKDINYVYLHKKEYKPRQAAKRFSWDAIAKRYERMFGEEFGRK
ncbi:MAG: glycosyltransferase family 4 protein [Candidatus Woesearchaeota archaeon]